MTEGLVESDGDMPATSPPVVKRPGDMSGAGAGAREQRAAALDTWLANLLNHTTPAGPPAGVALVALGGLGRRECAPNADVDLVLLHTGLDDIGLVAEQIWYPIWDAGM